jgi:PAS domain S-box-containing protein
MSGFQQPLFAPAHGGKSGEPDLDLNDLFADYFVNEMEDPLRTFNQTVNAAMLPNDAASTQNQLQQQAATLAGSLQGIDGAALPTGRGIQTAFHSNNNFAASAATDPGMVATAAAVAGMGVPGMGSSFAHSQQAQAQAQEPAPKKSKMEQSLATGGGVSSRLGFPMQPAMGAGGGLPQQQQVSLPVGVGIRIGGNGGVATGPGGMTMTHTQWGGSGAGVGLSHVQHGNQQMAAGIGAGAGYGMMGAHAGLIGASTAFGGPMSDQAVAERRQRNREHAKRSRVRKKFMLESLQQEVNNLQKENEVLRQIIQAKIPEHAQKILDDCCEKSPLFDDNAKSPLHDVKVDDKDNKELVKSDFSLISSLTTGQQNFVLSDPRLPDNPIVYASQGFYELTGYTREQVLGRNCRFLQGPGTDPKAVDVIRQAIANGTDATTCILNYKADGTPFWNQFFVAALRDQDNCIVNYVGVQCAVDPEHGANALEDKVNMVMPLKEKEDEGS